MLKKFISFMLNGHHKVTLPFIRERMTGHLRTIKPLFQDNWGKILENILTNKVSFLTNFLPLLVLIPLVIIITCFDFFLRGIKSLSVLWRYILNCKPFRILDLNQIQVLMTEYLPSIFTLIYMLPKCGPIVISIIYICLQYVFLPAQLHVCVYYMINLTVLTFTLKPLLPPFWQEEVVQIYEDIWLPLFLFMMLDDEALYFDPDFVGFRNIRNEHFKNEVYFGDPFAFVKDISEVSTIINYDIHQDPQDIVDDDLPMHSGYLHQIFFKYDTPDRYIHIIEEIDDFYAVNYFRLSQTKLQITEQMLKDCLSSPQMRSLEYSRDKFVILEKKMHDWYKYRDNPKDELFIRKFSEIIGFKPRYTMFKRRQQAGKAKRNGNRFH